MKSLLDKQSRVKVMALLEAYRIKAGAYKGNNVGHAIRVCQAIIARLFGYTSRSDWTEDINAAGLIDYESGVDAHEQYKAAMDIAGSIKIGEDRELMKSWGINGWGFHLEDILPLLDAEKLRIFMVGRETCMLELCHMDWQKYNDMDNLARLEYLDGDFCEYTDNVCGLLAEADELQFLTSANDGDGGYFLLYPPKYPWQMKKGECPTEEDAKLHLLNLLLQYTLPDISSDDLAAHLCEINVTGFGG
jgi:hypothetical protein